LIAPGFIGGVGAPVEGNLNKRVQDNPLPSRLIAVCIYAFQASITNKWVGNHVVYPWGWILRTIVLLSGGIDSAVALYLMKQETNDIYCITMIYTQSYDSEAEAAKKLAAITQAKEHLIVYLPFFKDVERRYQQTHSSERSSSYIPARNIVFYGVAASYAEAIGAGRIVFGSNADDAKELPDATSQFIQLMNELIANGTKSGRKGVGVRIVNPLIDYTKAEALKLGLKLKVPLELTWSCYEDAAVPCGRCRGCRTRRDAFQAVGVPDPAFTWPG
jgi:7-cyano-7-deazaguanine synthase